MLTQLESQWRTGDAGPGWNTSPPAVPVERVPRDRRGGAPAAVLGLGAIAVGFAVAAASAGGPDRLTGGVAGSVRSAPDRQIPAGRLASAGPAAAPASATVSVLADPQGATELVGYRNASGARCLGVISPNVGGGTCPSPLQPGAAPHIYVEGQAGSHAPALAWGFVPASADRLILLKADGAAGQIPLYDAGPDFGVSFFLTRLDLTADKVTLRAVDADGKVVVERDAGGTASR